MTRRSLALLSLLLSLPARAEKEGVILDRNPVLVGATDPRPYLDAVAARMRMIEVCYGYGKEENPRMAGRLVAELTILPEGKIEKVSLKTSTLGSEDIDYCVLDALGGAKTPAAAGPVTLTVLLDFVPPDAPIPAPTPAPAPAPAPTAGGG